MQGVVHAGRLEPDGGVRTAAAGDEPPPADGVDEFAESVLSGSHPPGDCYVLRLTLAGEADEQAPRVLEGLREEVEVLGSSHGEDLGPDRPDRLDVGLVMDYDPETVVDALVRPSEVAGARVVDVPLEPGPSDVEAEDGSAGDDVDRAPQDEEDTGPADDAAEAGEATAGDGDEPEAGGDAGPGTAEGDAGGGAADPGSQPSFEEVKAETEPAGYDEVVDQLESTTMPGEFDAGADLSPHLEDDGADADGGEPSTAAGDGDRRVARVGDGGDPGTDLPPEAVVDALVTALEEDALTDEQERTLGEALDDGPPKTLVVKLDHLQREVDELTAYKDALEEFIDEYGTGEGLVEEVRETMQQFSSDIERIGGEIRSLRNDLADAGDRLDDVDERVGAVDERLDTLSDRVDQQQSEVDERLSDLSDRVDQQQSEADERLSDLSDRLAERGSQVDEVVSRTEELDGELEDLRSRVEDQGAQLASLEDVDSRVEALEEISERVRTLETDLDELGEAVEAPGDADEAVAERLDDVEESLSELGMRVSVLESDTDDAVESLDDVAERLDTIEQRLADHEEWREQFQSLLGESAPSSGDQLG